MSAADPVILSCQPDTAKALEIPEIALLVGQYLEKLDLASCILVAHSWFSVFMPLFWRSIKINHPSLDQRQTSQNNNDTYHETIYIRSLLSKYGRFIKTITTVPEPQNEASDTHLVCNSEAIDSLAELLVILDKDQKDDIKSIVTRNQYTLRSLKLAIYLEKRLRPSGWLGERIFNLPTMLPCLQSLYLEFWCMTKNELIMILKACPNLKLLSLGNIHILDQKSITNNKDNSDGLDNSEESLDDNNNIDQASNNFQHQSIESFRMCSKLCPILNYLPRIKLLEFYRFDRQIQEQDLQQFCASIRTYCPSLQDIWAYGFECSMLPAVLDSLPQLISFRGCNDLPTVLSILSHALTLEVANLSDYTERTFLPLQFLESCPRLKVFWTGHSYTTMNELLHSLQRGWDCQSSLMELRLSILKLSPIMIEAIMRELKATRAPDSKQRALKVKAAREGLTLTEFEQRMERELVDSIQKLLPAERDFCHQVATSLAVFAALVRLNFGTGWYILPVLEHLFTFEDAFRKKRDKDVDVEEIASFEELEDE
ncbi:hypothetical protein FBU30_006917 [Linnemannia zychae]|nr:hypothetical protein FBU30_006917 [Linnemannia zychae]